MLFCLHIILCTVINGTVLVLAEPQFSVSVFDVRWTFCQSESGEMSEKAVSLSGVVKWDSAADTLPSHLRHIYIESILWKVSPHLSPGIWQNVDSTIHGVLRRCENSVLTAGIQSIRADTGRNLYTHTQIYIEKATTDVGILHAQIYRRVFMVDLSLYFGSRWGIISRCTTWAAAGARSRWSRNSLFITSRGCLKDKSLSWPITKHTLVTHFALRQLRRTRTAFQNSAIWSVRHGLLRCITKYGMTQYQDMVNISTIH